MTMTMRYAEYKKHYSDCETVRGTYNAYTRTISVVIPDGRLKPSGVRGKHFHGYAFKDSNGKLIIPSYRAVSEENARKQLAKDFPDSDTSAFELYTVY